MKSRRDFGSWLENLEARLHTLKVVAASLIDGPSSRNYSDLELHRDLDYTLFYFEDEVEIQIIEASVLSSYSFLSDVFENFDAIYGPIRGGRIINLCDWASGAEMGGMLQTDAEGWYGRFSRYSRLYEPEPIVYPPDIAERANFWDDFGREAAGVFDKTVEAIRRPMAESPLIDAALAGLFERIKKQLPHADPRAFVGSITATYESYHLLSRPGWRLFPGLDSGEVVDLNEYFPGGLAAQLLGPDGWIMRCSRFSPDCEIDWAAEEKEL